LSDALWGIILKSVGGKMMRRFMGAVLLAFLLTAAVSAGISQLRNNSEYFQDRINIEQTYFVLRDTGAADFAWASEWTNTTVQNNEDKSAMFLWHFKDGTTAYSLQAEYIGDIGKNAGFLLSNQASNLEDIHRKPIQPLTRGNYPVKVELWVGEIADSTGFSPELMGEAVCLDAQSIEPNRKYRFSSCRP
jgi:hypothetical protein